MIDTFAVAKKALSYYIQALLTKRSANGKIRRKDEFVLNQGCLKYCIKKTCHSMWFKVQAHFELLPKMCTRNYTHFAHSWSAFNFSKLASTHRLKDCMLLWVLSTLYPKRSDFVCYQRHFGNSVSSLLLWVCHFESWHIFQRFRIKNLYGKQLLSCPLHISSCFV